MKRRIWGTGRGVFSGNGFRVRLKGAAVLLLLSTLASAAYCDDPELPWHLGEWSFRQVVRMEVFGAKPYGNTILAEFHAAPPLLAEDGRDVRVVDEKGRPVRYQWVNEQGERETDPFGEGKRPLLHMELTDIDVRTYVVYFGNPDAAAEEHTWDKVVQSLILETRVCPDGAIPKNWREMTQFLARSNFKYDEGPRRQINDSENPFGPDEKFISIYSGMLNCPTKGEYGFATDSDDASFLLIDGMPVIQWAGGHPPSGKFDHYATVKLTAAPHRIQYYHVQSGGGTLARAGWRPPGATEFEIIPEEAFIRENRTRVTSMERQDSLLNAFFVAHVEGALQFGAAGAVFTNVRFENLSRSSLRKVAAWEWDLGDGGVSREANPSHVYHGGGLREVTLKCIDELGNESAWTRSFSLANERVTRADIAMELTADRLFVLPGEPISAGIKFCNTSGIPLEMTLVTEIQVSPGSVLQSEREDLTLEPDRWLTREVSAGPGGEVFFDTGDIAFRLEYRGETVASQRIIVLRATDRYPPIQVEQGRLLDDEGATVVLRLSGKASERQGLSLAEKLASGETVNIVAVDGVLLGAASSNYLTDLAALLQERFPKATINVSNVDPESAANRTDAVLRGVVDIGNELSKLNPDLVILSGSLRDVLRFTPTDRFKRMFHARVDRIRSRTKADILLLAQPPTIANPKLAQDYAMRVKELGLLRGLPVADAFSAFMTASGATSARGENDDRPWRRYYRDPDSEAPMYYVAPAPQGQRLIAETLLAIIDSEKPPK